MNCEIIMNRNESASFHLLHLTSFICCICFPRNAKFKTWFGNTVKSLLLKRELVRTLAFHLSKYQPLRFFLKCTALHMILPRCFCDTRRVIPQYLMYRPANSVPYATVEADLNGVLLKYCEMDAKGKLVSQAVTEVEQKCCTFQHWIHQWTHGNLLVTRLEGKPQI